MSKTKMLTVRVDEDLLSQFDFCRVAINSGEMERAKLIRLLMRNYVRDYLPRARSMTRKDTHVEAQ